MTNQNSNWISEELADIYRINFQGGNVKAASEGMAEYIGNNFAWLERGMIQKAFTAMIVYQQTPQVDHKYCFNVQYVSQVLWNYKQLLFKTQKPKEETRKPSPQEIEKISAEAVLMAFKRFKEAGRVFLLNVHYDCLKRLYSMPQDYTDFLDAAKAAKLMDLNSKMEQAKRDVDRLRVRSLREQIDNFSPLAASLDDTAKLLAVQAFFESLIKEGKEL